jgi:cytochrome c2
VQDSVMRSGRSIWRQALAASLLLAVSVSGAFAAEAAPKSDGAKAATAGDPVRGKSLFVKCVACHTVAAGQNRLGPSLAGVVGHKAASVPGFRYSPAMQRSGLVWTRENLDRYVAAPAAVVKGTFMTFQGVPDARDRADLIAYLATTGTTGAKTP